jgi:hypothetical protein
MIINNLIIALKRTILARERGCLQSGLYRPVSGHNNVIIYQIKIERGKWGLEPLISGHFKGILL